MAYYLPESGLGVAGIFMAIRSEGEGRTVDNIPLTLFLTTRGQYGFLATPNVFLDEGRWEIRSLFSHTNYRGLFYGLGPRTPTSAEESFTFRSWVAQATGLIRLWSGVKAGPAASYRSMLLVETRAGGLFYLPSSYGVRGETLVGIGGLLEWDFRNHQFWPTSGGWYQYRFYRYESGLGGDASGVYQVFEGRHFFEPWPLHVLAFHAVTSQSDRALPFDAYLPLSLRGISEDRLRDRAVAYVQGEFRFPISADFFGAGFLGVGTVGDGWAGLSGDTLRPVGGTGLRYVIEPREKVTIRLDVGVSEYGADFYILLQEAF